MSERASWIKPVVVAAAWSVLATTIVVAFAGPLDRALGGREFASRWDGGCNGWTRDRAWLCLLEESLHFLAYNLIAFSVLYQHPIIRDVPQSRLTMGLMFGFILGCGFGHLLDAYAVVHPIYDVVLLFDLVNGLVSLAAAWQINLAFLGLIQRYLEKRRRLEELQQEGH